MDILTDTQKQLLDLLSVALFNRKLYEAEYNWDELKQEALDQTVFTIVYPVVKDLLPDDILLEWEKLNSQIIANNLTVDYEHSELHELLTDNNISYVVLKGYSSAYYYPDPVKRMMGDVDFLVQENVVDNVGKLLNQIGFTRTRNSHFIYDVPYKRDNSIWELHFSVSGIPDGIIGEDIRKQLSDVINKSRLIETDYGQLMIPSDYHNALIMLLHLAKHITQSDGIGLRHLCDWAVFVDKVDIIEYKQKLSDVGLWSFACILTNLCDRYLGLSKKEWCTELDNDILEYVLYDVVSCGNFGVKDKGRGSGNSIVRKSNPLLSLADRTQHYYPFTKRYPILLPFGMAAYFCRFVWLRISGKREWVTSHTIKEAKKRRAVYEKIRLFEV